MEEKIDYKWFESEGEAYKQAKLLLVSKYTPTQLRNFLNHFESIMTKIKEKKEHEPQHRVQEFLKFEIAKVFPLIANAQGRQRGSGKPMPEHFANHLKDRLKKINTVEDFEIFIDYYKAIIAYFNYIEKTTAANQNRGGR